MRESVRVCNFERQKNDRSSWTFLFCLRINLFEDCTHRATYIVDGFLCMVTAIGNIIYCVVWSALYLSLSLIKKNESFKFEGFQHIHSQFYHQESQWTKLLVLRSIVHRCVSTSQNNKIWDIIDLEYLRYENCKCLRRVHYKGISWCILTYFWKDIFLSWEIVCYMWSTFIVLQCIQHIT